MNSPSNMKPIPGLPHAPMRILHPNRCEKCKFRGEMIERDKFECRANPPTAQSFMVQQGPGRTGFITHTTFPVVQPDGWCGKFAPRIEGVH